VTLWTVDLAFRLTVIARIADAVAAGHALPGWYGDVSAWADPALEKRGRADRGSGDYRPGCAARRCRGVLDRVVRLRVRPLMLGEVAFTGDFVPALLYLAPIPLGIAALIRAGRRTPTKRELHKKPQRRHVDIREPEYLVADRRHTDRDQRHRISIWRQSADICHTSERRAIRGVGARSYLECLVALGDSHGFAHTV